jgi:hypothetical protein
MTRDWRAEARSFSLPVGGVSSAHVIFSLIGLLDRFYYNSLHPFGICTTTLL